MIVVLSNFVAAETQLAYDDGSSRDYGVEFQFPYQFKAVLFDIDDPVQLSSIDTFWVDITGFPTTERYKLFVVDSYLNIRYASSWLSQPIQGINDDINTWTNHDVSQANLILDNDFYVVVYAPVAGLWGGHGDGLFGGLDEMNLGYDDDSSISSYYFDGTSFVQITGGNYMIRANVEEDLNNAPTLGGILDSPDPVKAGEVLTVTPIDPDDEDDDTLQMVCSYSTEPNDSSQDCTNYPQDSVNPYDNLQCTMQSDSNDEENTVFCRLFDGIDYSNEAVTQSRDDNTAPEVSIIVGDDEGENTEYDNDLEVYATLANSDASGISSCRIDWDEGEGWESVISPSEESLSHTYADDGKYTIVFECTDNVGWEASAEDTIIVDTTEPVPGVLIVEDQPFDTDGNVELTWAESTDENGIEKYEIWRKDNNDDTWEAISEVDGSVLSYSDNGLVEDYAYTWYIKAVDPAENSDDTNQEVTIIDTTNPSTQIITPKDKSFANSDSVFVEAKYSNHNEVTCEASIDGGEMEDMYGDGEVYGVATYTFTSVEEGDHLIEVQCTDLAYLTSTDTVNIYVDTVNPAVEISLGDKQDTTSDYDNDGVVWVRLGNEDPKPSSGYKCEINWRGLWKPIRKDRTHDARYFLTDGIKSVSYRCIDNAGNTDEETDTILVDRVYPVSTASVTDGTTCNGEWYNTDVQVTLSAEDPGFDNEPQTGSGSQKIRYSFSGSIGTFMDYTGPITISNEGITTIYYYARDNAGNWEVFNTGLNEITVKIDKTDPETVISFPVETEHIANPEIVFSGIAKDPGVNVFPQLGSGVDYVEVQVERVSDGSVVLPWTAAEAAHMWYLDWTADENIEYVARARATDNACNTESTSDVTFTVQDDNYDYKYYTEDEIDAMIQSLMNQLDELENSLDITEEEVASLREDLETLTSIVMQNFDDIAELMDAITVLDARISNLEDDISVEFYYTASTDVLLVQGFAPGLAKSASIVWTGMNSGLNPETPHCVIVDNNSTPEFQDFSNQISVNWDADSYSLIANFYDDTNCEGNAVLPSAYGGEFNWLAIKRIMDDIAYIQYAITVLEIVDGLLQAQIDDLLNMIYDLSTDLTALQQEVDDLTAIVMAMNHGTINMEYFNKDAPENAHTLRVWGEAPIGAESARVNMKLADDTPVYESATVTVQAGPNENSYSNLIDLNGFGRVEYNVEVVFFDDQDVLMEGLEVGGIFDELMNYGIKDVVISSRVETYYNPNVLVPITYTVRVDETIPSADFIVRSTDGSEVEFNQAIRSQTLFAGETYTFSDILVFSELGLHDLVVEINDSEWTSPKFEVLLVNLPDETPESEAYITQPTPNWNSSMVGLYPYFINPFDENAMYWHSWKQAESFNLQMTVFEGTPLDRCFWWRTFNDSVTPDINLAGEEIRDTLICSGTIRETDSGYEYFVEEGSYDLFARAEFIGGVPGIEDSLAVGIDNTAPVINSIHPYEGAYSGVLTVHVNITDTLSGIYAVWVTVLMHDNYSVSYRLQANFDEVTETYVAVFDTIAMAIPDAKYDVNALVFDIAGNSNTMTVDPIIDNTAPEMIDPEINEKVCTSDYALEIAVTILDATSGVDDSTVYALITGPNETNISNEIVSLTPSGSRYIASYINEAIISGKYYVEIFASDAAGNGESIATSQNVSVEDCPTSSPGNGGGGGGGGSRGRYLCYPNWQCEDWGECANGRQKRTCIDLNECDEEFEGETEKSCSIVRPTENEFNLNQADEKKQVPVDEDEETPPPLAEENIQPETYAESVPDFMDKLKGQWKVIGIGIVTLTLLLVAIIKSFGKPKKAGKK